MPNVGKLEVYNEQDTGFMRLNSHTMTVTRLSMKVKGKKGSRDEMVQNQDDVKRSVSSLD